MIHAPQKPGHPWEPWAIVGLLFALLILLSIAGCGDPPPREVEPVPEKTTAPDKLPEPKTAEEAREQLRDMRGQLDDMQFRLHQKQGQVERLEADERRQRMVFLARVIQWISALAFFAGIILAGLSVKFPALKFVRSVVIPGAGVAMVTFGLASYLPQAAAWLGPVVLFITAIASLSGIAWLLFQLVQNIRGKVAAVTLVEGIKPFIDLPIERRRDFQRQVVGDATNIITKTKKQLGLR